MTWTPPPITPEVREKLVGHNVVASVSGGKDSAALSLWLTENEIPHRRVFADTGWEHPDVYTYLRGVLTEKIGPIDEVQGRDKGFANLVLRKGMFPSRMIRFCTQELKVFPIREYLSTIENPISTVGIRAAESAARSKLTPWEWQETDKWPTWRPLLTWSEQDVIDMHARHDLRPNPLYLKGASRVGCWPCIFSRRSEIAMVSRISPERITEIRELEIKVTELARARYAAKGTTFEEQGYVEPSFFLTKDRKKGGQCSPIDSIVNWATSKDPKEYPFDFPVHEEDLGCMRWGLCDGVYVDPEKARAEVQSKGDDANLFEHINAIIGKDDPEAPEKKDEP